MINTSEALRALSEALVKFDGAMVVASHDREFCRAIAPTHTVQVAGGRVDGPSACLYLSDAVFERAVEAHEGAGASSSSGGGAGAGAAAGAAEARGRLSYAEQKEKQKAARRMTKILSIIEKREAEMEEIVEEMCRMGSNADEIVATEARRSSTMSCCA